MPPRADAPTAVAAPAVAAAGTAPPAPTFSPLYRQIKTQLVHSLQAAEWQAGHAIPSEIELAARYGVSQGTVRKAIDEMAAENLLVRRQGKGTFVATHAEQDTQYRFLRLTPDDGSAPALERRLLGCRRQRAPADVARALALRTGDAAVQVRRLLLSARGPSAPGVAGQTASIGGSALRPVVLDDLWLPGAPFRELSAERLQSWRGPLYRLFEAEFSVQMIRADEKLRAVTAGADDAALLEVAEGTPLLSVERLSYTYGDRPMELRRGLYCTQAHHYRNALN